MINWVPSDALLKNKDARCIYCGEPSDVFDHLVPICFLESKDRKSGGKYLRAESCCECNLIISSRFFDSLDDRVGHVSDKLRSINSKLKVGSWTVNELSNMGHSLRSHVKQQIVLKDRSNRRAVWSFTPDYVEIRNDLEKQCRDRWPENYHLLDFIAPGWSARHSQKDKTP